MKTKDYPDAEMRRDTGISDSAEHAEFDMPGWLNDATGLTHQYADLYRGKTFLAEDVRYWARLNGLPDPPEQRAWGAVLRRAHREGHIARVGYGSARSSNLSPKVLWTAQELEDSP